MSKRRADPAFSLGALNICTGGTQIINVYGAGRGGLAASWDPFPFKLLFDDHEVATVNGDPHGDHWCVTGASGVGAIVHLFVAYTTAPPAGTTIYARVYDGLSGSGETYIHGDPRLRCGRSKCQSSDLDLGRLPDRR